MFALHRIVFVKILVLERIAAPLITVEKSTLRARTESPRAGKSPRRSTRVSESDLSTYSFRLTPGITLTVFYIVLTLFF